MRFLNPKDRIEFAKDIVILFLRAIVYENIEDARMYIDQDKVDQEDSDQLIDYHQDYFNTAASHSIDVVFGLLDNDVKEHVELKIYYQNGFQAQEISNILFGNEATLIDKPYLLFTGSQWLRFVGDDQEFANLCEYKQEQWVNDQEEQFYDYILS
jgi:hypothetical protein